MAVSPPRPAEQRKADALAALTAPSADVWVATASGGDAYLVPLSLLWTGDRAVVAVEPASRTARNIAAGGAVRLGVGPTRDVVMIDVEVESVTPAGELDPVIGDAYAAQADWDPRQSRDPYVYVTFRPTRVQAWREANEIPGRTLMRDRRWLV
jgi:hypothetical protein